MDEYCHAVPQMFQSPLHRGLGSDQAGQPDIVADLLVSIPSSSGTGFGPATSLTTTTVEIGFNPLFIGAWVRTEQAKLLEAQAEKSFNPLFIGAWVRTGTNGLSIPITVFVSIPSSSGPGFGQRASFPSSTAMLWFQSPLHRGLGSDEMAGKPHGE